MNLPNLKQLPVMIKVIITKYHCNKINLRNEYKKILTNCTQTLYIYGYIFLICYGMLYSSNSTTTEFTYYKQWCGFIAVTLWICFSKSAID